MCNKTWGKTRKNTKCVHIVVNARMYILKLQISQAKLRYMSSDLSQPSAVSCT